MDLPQLSLVRCVRNEIESRPLEFIPEASGPFIFLKRGSLKSLTQLNFCFESSIKICSRNRKYRDLSAVFMMLISGKTQISQAIESVGISDSDSEFLVAYQNGSDISEFIRRYGGFAISEDPGVPAESEEPDRDIFPSITDVIYELNRTHGVDGS